MIRRAIYSVALFALAACAERPAPRVAPPVPARQPAQGLRPVETTAAFFIDSRAQVHTSSMARSTITRLTGSVRVELDPAHTESGNLALTEWRWSGILRSMETVSLSSGIDLVETPACALWIVKVEANMSGARQVLAWTPTGVNTFVAGQLVQLTPLPVTKSPFELGVVGRHLKLESAQGVFEFEQAGLANPTTGDLSVQLVIEPAEDCPRERLAVEFDDVRIKALPKPIDQNS